MRFLEREGCHLCDDALALLDELGVTSIERVDIDHDDALVRDFGLRIPVLLDDSGRVLAEGVFERRTLKKALRERAR